MGKPLGIASLSSVDQMPKAARSFLRNIVKCWTCTLSYFAAYWFFDWISFLLAPEKIGITPWNPPVGVSVILLLTRGLQWAPLLFIANFSFSVLGEGQHADMHALVISASETLIYTFACWILKNRLRIDIALGSMRDIIALCAVMTLAAAFMGAIYVLVYFHAGLISANEIPKLITEYWVGDALGILILVPLFLTNYRKPRLWLEAILAPYSLIETGVTFVIVTLVCFLYTQNIHVFYLLFIPVLWLAITNGIQRVPAGLLIIQAGLLFFSLKFQLPKTLVTQYFPFFILSLTWTGLILGALVVERENSRIQIMKGNARLKALLDMTPECMLIVDIANRIVAANQNFARLYGTTLEELIGRRIEDIMPSFNHLLNGEASLFLPDNTIVPIDVSTSKVTFGDKYSSILTVRDITHRKQAERDTRQRRAATEQASRTYLTGSLAAVLAHELNQPLSAIMSYTSACKKVLGAGTEPSPKALDQLEKISTQAKRAGDIIRRLREFFQNSSIEIAPVNVMALVQETVGLLEDEITQTNTAIDIRIFEPLVAAADRIQIEQVLINLIRNSLEALRSVPADQRKIRIFVSRSMRGDIEFIVNDTGPGIAPEIANQLFNPFVTTRLSGMGLGLTISRSIVEAHNGRLWAELQSSSGAAMHFTIPEYEKP